jgi:hypothetical protein
MGRVGVATEVATEGYITKGTRIAASWYQANDPLSCLAGMQMKVGAKARSVTGVVRHVRGDHPARPAGHVGRAHRDAFARTAALVAGLAACGLPVKAHHF